MYESYPWPGAYTLRGEMKLVVKWFKELLDGVLDEIEKKDSPPVENK